MVHPVPATLAMLLLPPVAAAQAPKQPATFQTLRVVATGNSLTLNYSLQLQTALDVVSPGRFEADSFAVAGADAPEYAGLFPSPLANDQIIDFPSEVLALDPDVIVFMLGTNDANHDARGRNYFETYYESMMPEFVQRYTDSGAMVLLMNPPPILPVNGVRAAAEDILTNTYQPFLTGLAAQHRVSLVDLRTAVTSQPDWQSLYHTDGIHLTGDGYRFVADVVAQAVDQQVPPAPEPATSTLLIVGLGGIWTRRRRRS